MAYYGRRRRYRRRGSRRRVLSNKNVYGSRSSKAQANQIATLRNRVNSMYRSVRPEIRVLYNRFSQTFTNSAFSNTYTSHFFNPFTLMNASGSGMTTTGNALTMKNFILRGIAEYRDNGQFTTSNLTHSRTGSFRVLVVQLKSVLRAQDTSITSIINLGNSGADYENNTIVPLNSGASSRYRILYDKTYTISSENPIKQFRVNIPLRNSQCVVLDTTPDDVSVIDSIDNIQAKGCLLVGIITSGLYWESGVYEQNLSIHWIEKLAYTNS